MNKTKLGLSVGLLGAICYLLSSYNVFAAVALMVVILLVEKNRQVKVNAVQAVCIALMFIVLRMGWGIIDSFIGMIPDVYWSQADSVIYGLLSIGQTIITILFAAFTLLGLKINLPFISSAISDGE